MPQLLLFVPASKILFDQDDDSISIISVLQHLRLPRPPASEQPFKIIADNQWAVLSLWLRLDEDEGKHYEQRMQIVLPDGQVRAEQVIPFTMDSTVVRNGGNVQGFPVGGEGTHLLRLSLRNAGEGRDWETKAEYPIFFRFVDKTAPTSGEVAPEKHDERSVRT